MDAVPTTSSRGATPPPPQEFRVLTLPREASRSEVRTLLTQEAEYGHWELARSVLHVGGVRKVWLRRRLHRVASTL